MKNSFYGSELISSQIIGSQVPLGNVPLTFLNQNGASDIPTLFSVIEESENAVLNVIAGVESITTTSDVVSVSLVSGQKIVINIIKGSGSWGTMTLSPSYPFASITSTVGDTVTIEIDTTVTGGGGDYASVDYDSNDYLTDGQINTYVGRYEIDLLENGVDVGDIIVNIYPTLQVRRICKANSLNFAWLNKAGGWNSYALECKFIRGYDIGRQQTFETASNVVKRTELRDVFQNYSVIAELLTKFELDLLSSLRTSIQAYLYNDETLSWDIPIILDTSSFQTFGNRQRQTERGATFTFRIATKERIQTQ